MALKLMALTQVTNQAIRSVQQAMSMAMALMNHSWGLILPRSQRQSGADESYIVFGLVGGFSAQP
jgi:hypothetical protein